jgi:hypothetical protein
MTDNNKPVVNGVPIDIDKVQRMLEKLILREKTNLKTREKTDVQMVQMIKKMIEEEVECY